ncbi:stage V sporulation protein AA [Salsuginibacillus halophilus]|uniref:Stage V sporulation protein AA n=1 Tax=Salsuginibacillus halophilus TaxID=517424 RepID=A0A2P8HAR4_9BACI|nr:stage V sporulation protein AA [Salsuginibacillus halophilus]PSL43304.1 stage V sporulation protein AA [Salsuginibacillus halophilus]
MAQTVFLQLRPRLEIDPQDVHVFVKDIAKIEAPAPDKEAIEALEVDADFQTGRPVVVDVIQLVRLIRMHELADDVQVSGAAHCVILREPRVKKENYGLFVFVWLLLFIGSALAIMNFHEDVSMASVHQKMYFALTGKEAEEPLLLQFPYSLGLGAGMILFFNHVFKKRINDEPSPIEIEMFNYQDDIDRFVVENGGWDWKKSSRSKR